MNNVKDLYPAWPIDRQIQVNLKVAYWLTIVAREPQHDARFLRSVTELQHQILGQTIKMVAGEGERYPDAYFIDLLDAGLQQLSVPWSSILPGS